jgi:PHAX RNA-binding domain
MDRAEAVTTIAQKLGEVEREPLKKLKAVVRILGPEKALALCEKALEVEQQGGMMTQDGSRRRTPGGVFFYLVRGSNNKKVHRLWPQRTPESATPDTPPAGEEQQPQQPPHTPPQP